MTSGPSFVLYLYSDTSFPLSSTNIPTESLYVINHGNVEVGSSFLRSQRETRFLFGIIVVLETGSDILSLDRNNPLKYRVETKGKYLSKPIYPNIGENVRNLTE